MCGLRHGAGRRRAVLLLVRHACRRRAARPAAPSCPTEPGSARPAARSQADVPSAVTPLSPVATRRITSVLFGDLVGFTSLSEQRDQEDVRELLSAYFEECSRIVERYGGTVEKFIGDAVMAVWGVPTAHEDDAERAVRAGLELVNRVAAMGADLEAPDLAMRVGIVTGEVAVTIGATQQGMVAGDAVNTAARVQSAATPGPGLGRRDDPAADDRGDLLRRRRQPRDEGQGRPGAAVGGARGGGRGGRRPARRRAGGAAGRPRPRAAAGQGAVPRRRGVRAPGAAGRRGRGGHRQDPARLGVREVRRRAAEHGPLAQRPVPGLRRGGRLLRAVRGHPGAAPGAAPGRHGRRR